MSRAWKVLLVTSMAVYLVVLDITIVNVAFPDLTRSYATSQPATLAWVLSGYSIAFAACLLAAGRIADRYGRRRAFFLGLAIFTVASVACGLSPTPQLLIAARVIQAAGGALLFPASLALLLPEFPQGRRSAAIGIWGAVGGIAAATGPSLGSLLVEWAGWRAVFFVNAPVALAAWLLGRRILAESSDPDARGLPDILGAVIGAAAVAALTLSIVQSDRWGLADARMLSAVAATVVLGWLFVRRSARHSSPILDLNLFKRRFFTVANLANFFFSIGFFSMLFVNINFLTRVWDYPILIAGLAFTPGPLTAAAFAWPAGRLADRVGHARVVVPGAALFVVGILIYVLFIGPEPAYWAVYFPASVLVGAGVGLTVATISSASNVFLPPERFAMGSAFHVTVRQIGAALGIAIAVALLGVALDGPVALTKAQEVMTAFDRAWSVLAASVLVSGVIMFVAYPRPEALVAPEKI
jgi:EmrB/QacA subfamily drug resistance transporter